MGFVEVNPHRIVHLVGAEREVLHVVPHDADATTGSTAASHHRGVVLTSGMAHPIPSTASVLTNRDVEATRTVDFLLSEDDYVGETGGEIGHTSIVFAQAAGDIEGVAGKDGGQGRNIALRVHLHQGHGLRCHAGWRREVVDRQLASVKESEVNLIGLGHQEVNHHQLVGIGVGLGPQPVTRRRHRSEKHTVFVVFSAFVDGVE